MRGKDYTPPKKLWDLIHQPNTGRSQKNVMELDTDGSEQRGTDYKVG